MKKIVSAVAVAAAVVAAGPALAQSTPSTAPNLTALSAGVDYSTVGPAILAAGALGLTIKLAMVAVKYVRRVVGGA